MLDSKLFINAIHQLKEDKNIPIDILIEALKEAFVKTYHREFDPEAELRIDVDLKKGLIQLFHLKEIVETIEDELTQITIEEAKKINPKYKIGDKYEIEIEFTKDFSTLAALQVKQILRQKIREKEKDLVLSKYSEKIGDMIIGNIEKIKEHFYIVAFDNTFGFLNKSQVPRSLEFGPGDSIRAIITNIDSNSKGVPIILSINSVEFVKRIIEEEIPEVAQGTIIIDKIARYGGVRTKMIVKSTQSGLDAVGTIVGPGGERIQRIIGKVGREFIDVIPALDELDKQIARAFVPAKPVYVKVDGPKAIVVVKEEEFSSAIGRGGSNAKVVSKLLDIEIDVVKESEVDFKIPTGFTYSERKRRSSWVQDVDASKFMIEEESNRDDIFGDVEIIQKEEKNTNNFAFEEVAEIPEIDDFEGFADENFEMEVEETVEDIDYDKYYE